MKRFRLLFLLTLVSGCAYLNGIYNARQAEKRGDSALRRGREGEATSYFTTAAMKAETVLVRHGESSWADDAEYLAGRGWAYSGHCDQAVPHLEKFLAESATDNEHREKALLALGRCRVEMQDYATAESLLVMVQQSKDTWRSNQASIWAARSAMRRGETDKALAYLSGTGASVAEWELASAFLDAGEVTRAESLLVSRAIEGDYRSEALAAIPRLWSSGRFEAVERIVNLYDSARVRIGDRARLHLTLGDLFLGIDKDSAAAGQFEITRDLARDSVSGIQATVRLAALSLADLTTLDDIEKVIRKNEKIGAAVAQQARMSRNLLFMEILIGRTDYTGASAFLAAEVARDSLGAQTFAHNLFIQVVDRYGNSPIAPKALLAAAELLPDSAEAYKARMHERYARSTYTLALDGKDNPLLGRTTQGDQLLQVAWQAATKLYTDSLVMLRRAEQEARSSNRSSAPASQLPPL